MSEISTSILHRLTHVLNHWQPSTLKLLQEMVSINSFTANHAGVNQLGRFTADTFEPFGFQALWRPSIYPEYGDHLILSRRGKSNAAIGLISHLDTVFPPEEEELNQFHWRQDGDRIYGPGTVDIKGGTVLIHLILQALQEVVPDVFEHFTWHVMLNSTEEILSQDFAELCRETLQPDGRAALVFEAGRFHENHFTLVTARKGRATLRIETHGRGAHAGSHHPRGANAITQMAEVIQRLHRITDYSKGRTVNAGVVHGGTVVNRVPHHASLEVEMRAFDRNAFDEGMEDILQLDGLSSLQSQDGHATRTRVYLKEKTPPWPSNKDTNKLFQLWQQVGARAGIKLKTEQRGGLSDANYLWEDIPTIDGLGPCGDNAHCSEQSEDGSKEQEYVVPSSFVPKALLTASALIEMHSRE